MGRVFFGESMLSLDSNTSKLCLRNLLESGDYDLLDCQLPTDHLTKLGAIEISRDEFELLHDQLV